MRVRGGDATASSALARIALTTAAALRGLPARSLDRHRRAASAARASWDASSATRTSIPPR
eukprot:366546-Chlamydomonas_euryale.AAC.39